MNQLNHLELLEYIEPSSLSYQEWVNVGFALKHEGYSISDWENWSRNDSRFKEGECAKKWATFNEESGSVVTGGTIFELAKENGWHPQSSSKNSYELDWDDEINDSIIDSDAIDSIEIKEPDKWNPVNEIITYLSALFNSDEYVGYVTESMEKEPGKYAPANRGSFDRTAGQLIQGLQQCNGDIGAVLGDYNPEAGAWIRFNPLNGQGVRNTDIEDFRYALVESDSIEPEKQLSVIRQLELPTVVIVSSGGKSVHAIVKIEANNSKEYRERVDYLYKICDKNGLKIDKQNKNPSRLSRLPGIVRGDKKQFIIEQNTGKESWNEWVEFIESINDNLPDPESLADYFYSPPALADPIIDGILRQGHKMLIVGPSKSGKSFSLIELCIAIAEGKTWMGRNCQKGKVMYVNLELDRASCIKRFIDVYTALNIAPNHLRDITIWNLRGMAPALDKLVPKLIRRSEKMGYIAIIVDPIYKIITGDENSASEMAKFCNQFDKIATALNASVIYAHHHSKGQQSGKKSMDRASGSGVFARDPDALLDMIELPIKKEMREDFDKEARLKALNIVLDKYMPKWKTYISITKEKSLDDVDFIYDYASNMLTFEQMEELNEIMSLEQTKAKQMTALQINGTLREFPTFEPINVFFRYPIHILDNSGLLYNSKPESDSKKGRFEKMKESKKKENDQNIELFLNAFEQIAVDGQTTTNELANSGLMIGKTKDNIRISIQNWIKKGKLKDFNYKRGVIFKSENT
ncbi:MAG: AAA family ATPase [Eggerthia catenaformis]|uniref:AAA family ATPase n=1 Tax=Eggerthia catenaformis TaxID=31973 RepID=UPI003FA11A15